MSSKGYSIYADMITRKSQNAPLGRAGMSGQCGFGGVSPQAFMALSSEEIPCRSTGFFTRWSKYFIGAFMLLVLGLGVQAKSFGYVLQAEQLIQLMTVNASKFQMLVITQFTEQAKGQPTEVGTFQLFREKIWMQAPGRFQSKVLNEGHEGRDVPDMAYRRLLLADNSGSFMQLLIQMGINLEAIAFTRMEGVVAYRIGDAAPDSPKILIEKERFVPLQLTYWSIGDRAGALVKVTFKDYREVDKGWYPFEITHSSERWSNERYTILTILPNTPFDPSVFSSPMSGVISDQSSENDRGLSDEERLKRVIKKFEEKYR